jgi:endonuclease/exonuclease/phosphatase (EEP) superfamily protein YafD
MLLPLDKKLSWLKGFHVKRRDPLTLFHALVLALGIGSSIATFSQYGFRLHWFLPLFEHFRLQYCQILVVAMAAVFTFRRRRLWWGVFGTALLVNLWLIAPLYLPQPALTGAIAPRHLKILYATLDAMNRDPQAAVGTIAKTDADFVMVLEATNENLSGLMPALGDRYELVRSNPESWTTNGMALWKAKAATDVEIVDSTYIHLPTWNLRPLLKATVKFSGQVIDLLCLHAARPQARYAFLHQKTELDSFSQWSLENPHELIVLGDLNSTPWSRSVRSILANGRLLNSQAGFGLQQTWNAEFPKFLQIPIDHCFHSRGLRTVDRQVLGSVGSDHLPILVEMEVAQG